MKGKTSKIVLVLASLFFGVFFFFNDAFATVNWSQYGVEIVGLGFEETGGDLFLEFAYNNSVNGEWGDGTEVVCITKAGDGFSVGFPYSHLTGASFPGYINKISNAEIVGGENCFNALYDVGSGGIDAICTGLGGSCRVKYNTIYNSYNNAFSTTGYIDKAQIDNIAGTDFFQNAINTYGFVYDYYDNIQSWQSFYVGYYQSNYESIPIYFGAAASIESYIENSNGFPISSVPPLVDGACGTVTTFNYTDIELQDFCSAGDFYFTGTEYNGKMFYQCTGTGGGTNKNCSASYYINGDCGTLNGTTQASIGIENENLCSYSYLLDETSFSTTATGWSWICNGLYGGYDSFCTADKSDVVFPDTPELEDCSSYTFPNNWICSINNTLQSAFLPSAEKINELNLSINAIQQKAPFNYLNLAKTKITDLTNNITQDGLSMSILGNTSTINENALTTLADNVKKFFTFLLMLAFLFWGINYIKHFFK